MSRNYDHLVEAYPMTPLEQTRRRAQFNFAVAAAGWFALARLERKPVRVVDSHPHLDHA